MEKVKNILTENLKSIIIAGLFIVWVWITLAFNPIVDDRSDLVININKEISVIENQILDNKDEWDLLQSEIDWLNKQIMLIKDEQKVFNTANDELRKQIADLKKEKADLGL